MASHIGRRKFLATLGGAAAAWPVVARAQQPAMPVIGFLWNQSGDAFPDRLRAFRQGLKDSGYLEGENVAVVYRWAEGRNDRLPVLAGELIHRQVAVIVAAGETAASAAKAATTTIPIVFSLGEDPVKLGFVASLARPGGNLTGINFFNIELVAKRLELLRELIPGASRVAVLVNPTNPASSEQSRRNAETAARAMGLQATMAARHTIPMTSATREIAEAGGLMSYGTNLAGVWRQLGVYAGRILKGAKPEDLPVVQSSKFELVINHQTARMLGLTVPDKLLVAADDVIE
jgi:putative ABC transport system substrate-binding protein